MEKSKMETRNSDDKEGERSYSQEDNILLTTSEQYLFLEFKGSLTTLVYHNHRRQAKI